MTADAKATSHDWTVPGVYPVAPGVAHEAARCLRWTRRERQLGELDLFNQMLAVIETRAHLELLVAQGRLARTGEGGVTFYQEAGPTG